MGEFDNALILTSPHITGQKVKDAQWLLAGHNRFKDGPNPIHPYKGKIDGNCGPATITASREAKIWLGYPDTELDASFGQIIYGYLLDVVLPHDYQERRADRIVAAKETIGFEAMQIALTQEGTTDGGDDNTKYGIWYGFNFVPWCDIFVSWCLNQVGSSYRYSYVPTTVSDARENRNGLTLVTTPQPGDLMCYHTNEGPDMHIGFYVKKIDDNSFYDIAGNTGPTASGVYSQKQNMDRVSHIVRVR